MPTRKNTSTRKSASTRKSTGRYGGKYSKAAKKKKAAQKNPMGLVLAVTAAAVIVVGGAVFWSQSKNAPNSGSGNGHTQASSAGQTLRADGTAGPLSLAEADNWDIQATPRVQAYQFGGSGDGDEEIKDIAARGDGRLVLVGRLSSRDGIPSAGAVHDLVDQQSGGSYGFVAELSADGSNFNWFSLFGGDLILPESVALGPDGSIAIGGKIEDRMKSAAGPDAGDFKGRTGVVVKVSGDGSRVDWIREGAPNQEVANSVAVDRQGRVLMTGGTRGRGQAAYILRYNADGSRSTFPAQPSGREWAIDFDVRGGQFLEPDQIGAFYELDQASPDGYDYDGDGPWGPTWFKLFGMRQNINLVILPNDDIVASGTLQYDFKVKGKRSFPAFDTIVARWNPDGKLIWSTNMYQEGDGVHTPDQKDKDIIYNPVNGDLYVLVGQHGSNIYRFKGTLRGDTGNLFISWIGRLDTETGELKAGWYWQNSRNSGYTDNGIPQSPPHPRLAGNDASALGVDSQGHIYFAGNSGAKAFSTPNAWKTWPDSEGGGGNASLTVLSPDLDRILYATQIMGSEHSKSKANAVAVTAQGVWVGGLNKSRDFTTARAPWSSPDFSGSEDAALVQFQFD
ncbi:MAG: hypothetical protein ACLFS1_07325 [Opitutales bacterium]